jgi:two-component system, LytTR family, sensor kinase
LKKADTGAIFRVDYRETGIHIAGWLFYYVSDMLLFFNMDYNLSELTYMFFTCALPVQVAMVYFLLYWLIPRCLIPKRHLAFAIGLLASLALTVVAHRYAVHYWYGPKFRPEAYLNNSPWDRAALSRSLFYMLAVVGSMVSFHLTRANIRQRQDNEALQIARMSAELKSLKDQINPHFLFNTLNNLYGLTRSNPEKASEVVLRLSKLMHYMLHESNLEKVPLQKEIEHLENCIELEKIRYGDELQVSFQVRAGDKNGRIAPLLLLPFVENAFKHGLSKQLKDAWLQIDLSEEAGALTFKVANSKPFKAVAAHPDAPAGIGLENVSKRLELIYPGRHRLKIIEEPESYLAVLHLSLKTTEP